MKKVICIGNLTRRTAMMPGKKGKEGLYGPALYCAFTAKRMGFDVDVVSKLSSNFPEKWLEPMKKEKINLIRQPAWADTTYQVKYLKDNTKEVKIFSESGQIVSVPPSSCDVAIISSYFGSVGLNVLQTLKKENNIVALDAQGFIKYRNPDSTVSYVPWLDKEKYLKYVDILKLNANDLYYLTGKTTLNSAMDLLKQGPKVVVLTMGLNGSFLFHEKKYIKIPIYKTKTKEKLGAGDVYLAAFTLKYLETQDLITAGYFASAAASFVVEKPTTFTLPDIAKIEKRYKTLREIFLA